MSAAVLLDTGPLGILTNPFNTTKHQACAAWLAALQAAGRRIILPEIADYELRRELIRLKSLAAIAILDHLAIQLEYLPISTATMRLAAELWAQARNQGRQTASNQSLDGDVILAAQALSLNVPIVVATDNPQHIGRYVPADLWSSLTP